MCFRYRRAEPGGGGGGEASGSEGQEEREEGETLDWHRSARRRGNYLIQVGDRTFERQNPTGLWDSRQILTCLTYSLLGSFLHCEGY